MPPKPVVCTCSKRFETTAAMYQHQRDSPRHAGAPQAPERLEGLVQALSLQGLGTDHSRIPFSGAQQTTPPEARDNPEQVLAEEKILFTSEKTKRKRKKEKGRLPSTGQGNHSSWMSDPDTGCMMYIQDEDWALCDKDCGWCGHCADAGY